MKSPGIKKKAQKDTKNAFGPAAAVCEGGGAGFSTQGGLLWGCGGSAYLRPEGDGKALGAGARPVPVRDRGPQRAVPQHGPGGQG